jgi:hypothetical protein
MATAAEIIDLIHNSELSIEDRVEIVRALRNSTPDLVVPERRMKGRIDSAQGVRPEFVDSAILGLTSSAIWQQSASTSPKELRVQLDKSAAHRLLCEEARALAEIADYNSRYHHFLAIEKARAARRVGLEITGDAAILVQPHLEIMASSRPARRRIRPASQPASTTSPSAKQ